MVTSGSALCDFWVPQNPSSPLIYGEPEVVLGKLLMGTEDLQGVFYLWKYGKDRIKTNGDIRGPILGFEISDITYPTMHW